MNSVNSGMTPDEREDYLLHLRKLHLTNGHIKAEGREHEHLWAIATSRYMRWTFDPEFVQRTALKKYVRNTLRGRAPSPEVAAFLYIAPDPLEDSSQHGREATQSLRLRPPCRRSELLRWVETIDTLTVHYLSRAGGGRLTREEAAYRCDLGDRTFRHRLNKIRGWDLIGSARKPPEKLPVPRN